MLELFLVPQNIIILPFKELVVFLSLLVCLFVLSFSSFFLSTSRPCVNKMLRSPEAASILRFLEVDVRFTMTFSYLGQVGDMKANVSHSKIISL